LSAAIDIPNSDKKKYRLDKSAAEVNISVLFFIISAICFIAHFLFFRYSFPPVNVDEGSFFSPAYSFAKYGRLSSNIHQSFLPGSSRYTYWMPPFYLVVLGTLLKIAGITVFNAKVVSLIFTCFSAFLISTLTSDKYIKFSLTSLLLICPFIIITSAFIRVEALAILLIIISIAAIKFQLNEYVVGIIAGLGLMTHPLLVPCSAGLALIIMRRGIKPFLIFSLMVIVTISPYLYYISKDIELFKDQMALQFLRKSKAHLTDLKLSYILQSVPITVLALYCIYKIKQWKELRLFLAVSLILSLMVVLKSNEFNYQVYLMPYVLAAVGLAMQEKSEDKVYRYALPFLLYGFFAVLLISKIIKYHFRSDVEYKEMISYMDNNRSWNGKDIYLLGSPDISTFLLTNNQQVERQIPISVEKAKDCYAKYNYVVEVTDNNEENNTKNIKAADSTNVKPWLNWQKKTFTTSRGSYSMYIFLKQ
jgi:hypothetical protein